MNPEDSMNKSDKSATENKSWYNKPLTRAILLTFSVGAVGIWLGSNIGDEELKKALYSNSVALIFVALIGTIVKNLIDEHQKLRELRANQAQFLTNILADLKAVYDRVERARILIPAHRSALTYGKEMRDLIEARVKLRNVIRALDQGTSAIPQDPLAHIQLAVSKMEAYLAKLTNAFERDYWLASVKQKVYETKIERVMKNVNNDPADIETIENEAWEVILDMPETKGFLGDKLNEKEIEYIQSFADPLDLGTWILRNELQVTLGRTGATMPEHLDSILSTLKATSKNTGKAD